VETSLQELKDHLKEVKEEVAALDAEYTGREFTDEAKAQWERLKDERAKTEAAITEREERVAYLETLVEDPAKTEAEPRWTPTRGKRVVSHIPDDPTRLEEYRTMATSIDDLERAYTDGAKKVLETRFDPHSPVVSKEEAQSNVARILDTLDHQRGDDGGSRSIARRVISTSSREYSQEFGRYLATKGQVVGPEMLRAASLTTTAGGFAVPVILDPTVILTSAGQQTAIRQIARVEQVVGNTWEGISSTGITAAFSAEATEASDNAPALAQPTANVEKAQAFVPMSIEVAEDWIRIQAEMAKMLLDAKNRLESTKFLTGAGHSSQLPEGLQTGATATVSTATTAVFAVADLYKLENALSPRFKENASIVSNRAVFNLVRQFDTAGGASLWVQLQEGQPERLIGYPKYEWSDMSSASTSGTWIMTIGDFSNFVIVDRIGMNVEFIQHLFGTANNFPTGQRGLYCYWRTTSKVLAGGLQANSSFVTLKLL
jgi:HK97 family phage major capsid protein